MSLTMLTIAEPALAAGGYMLVSPLQPIIMLIPLVGWAWLVSRVFDKHAARFHLGQETWNIGHMIAGLAALAVVILMPLAGWTGFLIGLLLMVVILGADILLFMTITNKDERVPEHEWLKLDLSKIGGDRDAKKSAKQQAAATLGLKGPGGMVTVPPKDSPEYAVRVAGEQLIIHGQTSRASQVDIAPISESSYGVSLLIDGVRQAGEKLPAADAVKVIDFWKEAAGLDIEDRRRKQSDIVSSITEAGKMDIKVAASGSKGGMRLSLVFEPAKAVRRKIGKLGLLESQRETLDGIIADGRGVVLTAGPSDNGRTTTLYALLKGHDAYTNNVQTIEYEMEDALEGVKQNIFDLGDDESEFSVQLRSMLRRDPDVVGVGDLPDAETAKESAAADIDRTRVYLSMKADNALTAIQTYIKAVGSRKTAVRSLHGVIAQRLARNLCENCRVPYTPPPELLKKMGLPAGKVTQLFKKGGQVLIRNKPEVCPVCGGSGYVGQFGVFEVYPIGDAERALIAKGEWANLKAEWRKQKHPSISRAALRKAVDGTTSVEEVTRVTSSSRKKDKGSSEA